MPAHHIAEARSLAYHAEVAKRLRENPTILEEARARVRVWLARPTGGPHYAREWASVLSGSVESIAAFLVDRGERARELRQSTPFAGVLAPTERWRIWRDTRAAMENRA